MWGEEENVITRAVLEPFFLVDTLSLILTSRSKKGGDDDTQDNTGQMTPTHTPKKNPKQTQEVLSNLFCDIPILAYTVT